MAKESERANARHGRRPDGQGLCNTKMRAGNLDMRVCRLGLGMGRKSACIGSRSALGCGCGSYDGTVIVHDGVDGHVTGGVRHATFSLEELLCARNARAAACGNVSKRLEEFCAEVVGFVLVSHVPVGYQMGTYR